MIRHGVAVLITATLALSLRTASADPVELPPEAVDGSDHALDAADTLGSGDLELGVGASGTADAMTSKRRRVRFSEPDLRGTVREGAGDPLAGARLEGGTGSTDLAVGTLSPRWARGLVMGAGADPWQRSSLVADGRGRPRSGEGVSLRSRSGHELMLGRFVRNDLVAGRIGRSIRVGLVAGRRGVQTSLGLGRGETQGEIAMDRQGTWRGEALLERGLGSGRVIGSVRAGHAGFRSLAEPARAGPARAATLACEGRSRLGDLRLLAAAWTFRAAEAGGRLAAQIERRLPNGADLAAGFEEQHGVRREHQRDPGVRQGVWVEWSRLGAPLGLAARHEAWTARGGLRGVVREVSAMRAVARLPAGVSLSLGHAFYRVRRGESLYLREAESDRVVLRALTGEGHRTRVDLGVPLARGTLRAALHLDLRDGTRRSPRWDLEWSRRSRPSRRPPGTVGEPARSTEHSSEAQATRSPHTPPRWRSHAHPGDAARPVPVPPRVVGPRAVAAAPQRVPGRSGE